MERQKMLQLLPVVLLQGSKGRDGGGEGME
jgi:hypothetical protein